LIDIADHRYLECLYQGRRYLERHYRGRCSPRSHVAISRWWLIGVLVL
jgi:hypothetical protein